MKRFLRGCLLFLQCLVTWPWAMPLALFVLTVEGFNYRRVGGRFTDIWKIAFGAGKSDWHRRIYWVKTGESLGF